MTGIKVTPEQLQQLSGSVGRGSAEIGGQLGVLGSAVAPLVGGDWAGAASAQFASLWEQWQSSARGLQQALDGISVLLGQAGRAYEQAEQQIASSFRA
jgi:WXG100 family type VII secretion target